MRQMGRMLYSAIFRLVRRRFQNRYGIDVWTRNSFRQGNFVPFLSDIDLSFEIDPSNADVRRILNEYGQWRRFLPVLGEVNIYSGNSVAFVLDYGNAFELSRDPDLFARHQTRARKGSHAEAFVFLMRMWAADLHNLRDRPHRRVRKWSRHLEATGRGAWPAPFDARTLIRCLDLGPEIQTILEASLASANWADELYARGGKFRAGLAQVFFTEWIRRFAFESGATSFESAARSLMDLPDLDRERLWTQIQWELAYLCNQYPWLSDRPVFLQHIRLVFRVARLVTTPERSAALQREYLKTGLVEPGELED